MTMVCTRPGRPWIVAYKIPSVNGATKSPRPVESVVTWSPFENATVTPGVNLPFTSSTASVVRSPETIFLGTSRIRAFFAAGACCSFAIVTTGAANNNKPANFLLHAFMAAIVGENRAATKPAAHLLPRSLDFNCPPPAACASDHHVPKGLVANLPHKCSQLVSNQ